MSEIKQFKHPLLEFLKDKKFVLASTSIRRLEILQLLKIPNLEVVGSNFEEDLDKSKYTPDEYVVETARGKALEVWERLKSQASGDYTQMPHVLLSADTVVECNGRIFEKPKSIQDNIQSIKYIRDSGIDQRVLTGMIILVHNGDGTYKITEHLEVAAITMDPDLSDELIELYCETGEGMGVAGGYRIQGYGSLFMKEIRGDYYNIVGLPFRNTFITLLKLLGIPF